MNFTAGEIISTLTAFAALIAAFIAWNKSRPDIVNTQQKTIRGLVETQDLLVVDIGTLKSALTETTEDRDKWRELAECFQAERDEWRSLAKKYKLGLEKAERRIEELIKKWD